MASTEIPFRSSWKTHMHQVPAQTSLTLQMALSSSILIISSSTESALNGDLTVINAGSGSNAVPRKTDVNQVTGLTITTATGRMVTIANSASSGTAVVFIVTMRGSAPTVESG